MTDTKSFPDVTADQPGDVFGRPVNSERALDNTEKELGPQFTHRVDVRLRDHQYAWLTAWADHVRGKESRNVTVSEMVRDAVDYWINNVVSAEWVRIYGPVEE